MAVYHSEHCVSWVNCWKIAILVIELLSFLVKRVNNSRAVRGCWNERREEAAAWFWVLFFLCCWHRDVIQRVTLGSEALERALRGFRLALIAYLLLPWDVIQLQASQGSLPAAVLCFGLFCNTSRKDGVGPLYLWLCNTPCRHTQMYAHMLTYTCTNMHARTCSHAHRHCI